nr:MAG TPA: hypothetical protein [Caudoviricetes sp.]
MVGMHPSRICSELTPVRAGSYGCYHSMNR